MGARGTATILKPDYAALTTSPANGPRSSTSHIPPNLRRLGFFLILPDPLPQENILDRRLLDNFERERYTSAVGAPEPTLDVVAVAVSDSDDDECEVVDAVHVAESGTSE